MISADAYREREWHQYPALRQALENAEVPPIYSGFTSVTETVFDQIVRLMKHALLVKAYQDEIIRTADSTGKAQMSKDLWLLEQSFAHAAEQFSDARRTVSKLRHSL